MKLITLKCPNCGALVPKETMTCKYCGAHVLLSPDGHLTSKAIVVCPKCGSKNAKGSWFCMSCGNIITDDTAYLRQIQKRIRFKQNNIRKKLPQKLINMFKLGENEFIHYAHSLDNQTESYVVTEKRFIKFFDKKGPKIFGAGKKIFWEASWDEIATVSEPIPVFTGCKIIFTTFDEEKEEITLLPEVGVEIFRECMNAMDNFVHQKRDARAKLCYLSLRT